MATIRMAVVHRDPRLRELLAEACQPPSFCANFAMASTLLSLVHELSLDCVVSELQPLDMDAGRFIRELRDRQGVKLPLLILTPPRLANGVQPPLAEGVDDVLSEPFSVKDVLERVRALLAKTERRPAASPESARPPATAGPRKVDTRSTQAARRRDLWPAAALGAGHFTRIEVRGRSLVVLTEASLRPFVITTVVTEHGAAIRRIRTELPHGLARAEDAAVVREQVERQHEAALSLIDSLALEPGEPRAVWPRPKAPNATEASGPRS